MQLKTGLYHESINTEVKSILFLTHSNRTNSLSLLIAGAFVPHVLKGQSFRVEVGRHMAFPSKDMCQKPTKGEKMDNR